MSQTVKFTFFVLVAPSLLFFLFFWPLTIFGLGASADFIAFYGAGKIVWQGSASDLYNLETQRIVQREYTGHRDPLPFYHPPFEALLFAPLSYFSSQTAYRLWVLANLYVLGLVGFFLEPQASNFGLGYRLLLAAVSVWPLLAVLLQGQDSLLLLLVYTLVYLNLRSHRQFAAGCFLAAGLFKFHLVLPFLTVFCARKKGRIFGGFATVSAGLTLVSGLLMGWRGLLSYPQLLWQIWSEARPPDEVHIPPAAMPSLRGFTYTLLADRLPVPYLQLVILMGSAALLYWSVKSWNAPRGAEPDRQFDLQFAFGLVITLLVSYHLLLHDLSLLVLPTLLVLKHCSTGQLPQKVGRALVAILGLQALAQTYLIFFDDGQFSWLFCTLLAFALAIRKATIDLAGRSRTGRWAPAEAP